LAKNGRYGGCRMKEDFIGSKSISLCKTWTCVNILKQKTDGSEIWRSPSGNELVEIVVLCRYFLHSKVPSRLRPVGHLLWFVASLRPPELDVQTCIRVGWNRFGMVGHIWKHPASLLHSKPY
jgi:hypothetical protein